MWSVFAVVALCFLTNLTHGLYFHMGETEKKCFIEEIPDETMVIGESGSMLIRAATRLGGINVIVYHSSSDSPYPIACLRQTGFEPPMLSISFRSVYYFAETIYFLSGFALEKRGSTCFCPPEHMNVSSSPIRNVHHREAFCKSIYSGFLIQFYWSIQSTPHLYSG